MRAHHLTTLTIALAATVALSTPAHAATEENPAARFLVDYGKKFYDQGNMAEAAHEFSKALLIDPSNQEALDYLANMGFEGGLYPIKGTYEDRVMRRAERMEALETAAREAQERTQVLESVAADLAHERNTFEDELDIREKEVRVLSDEVDGLRETNAHAGSMILGQIKDLEGVEAELKEARVQIEALSADLANKDKRVGENEAHLKALDEELNNLRTALTISTKEVDEGKAVSKKLAGISKEIATLNQLLNAEEISLRQKNEDLTAANERARQLERQLALAGPVISGASQEHPIEVQSKSLEQEVVLKTQAEQIETLKAKIADLQERLNLTQRIVQEKEAALQDLSAKLTEAQSKCTN